MVNCFSLGISLEKWNPFRVMSETLFRSMRYLFDKGGDVFS